MGRSHNEEGVHRMEAAIRALMGDSEALRAEGVRWLIVEGRTPHQLEPGSHGGERHRESAKGWDAVVLELDAPDLR